MIPMVVDASVAAKWLLPKENEPLTAEAIELFRRYSRGEISFIVPDLFWAEMANIIRDVSAGLIGFCLAAPCGNGVASIALKTPTVNFNNVPAGGTTTRAGLARFLRGDEQLGSGQHDVLAHALNERFVELDMDHPVPYAEGG